MRNRWRRAGMWLGTALTGGVLFAVGSEAACISFAADRAESATDFCFLFDCQNGAYGGLVEFCSNSALEVPLFTDCPQFTQDGNP